LVYIRKEILPSTRLRLGITVTRTALAKRAFGREQLKPWRGATDGSPQAECDFKFYRQATNKIGGISEEAGKFLGTYFERVDASTNRATRLI
jgi:hypothetical protein